MSVLGRGIKVFFACFSLLSGILVVSYVQKRFDDADMKKALQALQAIQSRFPKVTECGPEVTSKLRGRVQVICREGRWIVDVVEGTIEPTE